MLDDPSGRDDDILDLTPPAEPQDDAADVGGAAAAGRPHAQGADVKVGAGAAAVAVAGDDARDLLAGLDERIPRWIVRLVVAVVLGVFVVYISGMAVSRLRDLLAATVASLFISFALEPAVNWLAEHGWKRWVATLVVVLLVLIILLAFIASMVPLIIAQVQELIGDIPGWIERISEFSERVFDRPISNEWITDQIRKLDTRLAAFGADMAKNVFGVGVQLFKFIFFGFTVVFFTFYLIADAPRLRRWICSMMRPDRQRRVLWAWETAIDKTGGYIYSRAIMGAIAAVLMFVVLEILGVPYPLPLALWTGIFSQLIPTIGTYIAAVLPLFVALLHRPITALVLLIYIIVYQILENYTLAPKVSARTMQIHAGIAFAATIAGASLFGVIGAFLALPVAAILQAGVETYVSQHQVVTSHLTGDAAADLGKLRPPRTRVGWRVRVQRAKDRVWRRRPPGGEPPQTPG